MPDSDAAGSRAEIRGVRRGRFTITRLHRRGTYPMRVLVVGSQLELGRGVLQHQAETLADQLTDRLWLRSRRGVDLDVLWELRPVLRAVRGGLTAWRLWRYDAVVVVAPGHALGVVAQLRMLGVLALLRSVIQELAAASHVLVVSLESRHAWRTGTRRATMPTFAEGLRINGSRSALVDAIAVPHDGASGADMIADRLVDALGDIAAPAAQAGLDRRDDIDPDRQKALGDMAVPAELAHRLQQVAVMARNTFETEYAEIDLISNDRQRTLAAASGPAEDLPLPVSLCAHAIETPGATVIEDALEEFGPSSTPRIGSRYVRFYAAYPIESPDGYRIGALCVFDTTPLPVDEIDLEALRDLALLAEAELISSKHNL